MMTKRMRFFARHGLDMFVGILVGFFVPAILPKLIIGVCYICLSILRDTAVEQETEELISLINRG